MASASLRVQINFIFIVYVQCILFFFLVKSQNQKELPHHYFRFYYYSSRILSANLLFLRSFVTDIQPKPPHVLTSIKQSPVLEGHLFLVLS